MSRVTLVAAVALVAMACLAVASQNRGMAPGVSSGGPRDAAVSESIALPRVEPSAVPAGSSREPTGHPRIVRSLAPPSLAAPAWPTSPMQTSSTPATAAPTREILWRPAPDGQSEFGVIPTDWTTRPQLLPGTWEVETVFARRANPDDAEATSAAIVIVAPRTMRTSAEFRR